MLKASAGSGIFGLYQLQRGSCSPLQTDLVSAGGQDDLSDSLLVSRTLSGDKRAFEILVRRYQKLVYNVTFQMTRSHESAADLTQETFLRAFRALSSFKQEANFRPWLLKIATNASLNSMRGRPTESLEAVLDDNPRLEPASSENLELEVERRFTQQLLSDSLARLPARYRHIFALRYQQDLSYDEIAEAVGETTSSIKSLLFRVREKLRKLMHEEE